MTDNDRRNLAHVALLVFDVTPKAIRRIVNNYNEDSTAHQISEKYVKYMRSKKTRNGFFDSLNKQEKRMLRNLDDGFGNCDTSFLYKIIRNYNLVAPPTHVWTNKVEDLKNYGDVVETFKQMRNLFVHRPQARFSDKSLLHIKQNIVQSVVVVSKECEEKELLQEMISHLQWLG